MRIPLHVIAIDRDKRFVDFAVAGRPTSAGTRPLIARPAAKAVPASKHHGKAKPKPAAKPAAKAGPPTTRQQPKKLKHKRRR